MTVVCAIAFVIGTIIGGIIVLGVLAYLPLKVR